MDTVRWVQLDYRWEWTLLYLCLFRDYTELLGHLAAEISSGLRKAFSTSGDWRSNASFSKYLGTITQAPLTDFMSYDQRVFESCKVLVRKLAAD